ncbi:ABC transporter ATP-binding protein [bacterium]|nr:ABC transporter ATP-binding protein [bacterium]
MNMLQPKIIVKHLSKVYFSHLVDSLQDKNYDKTRLSSDDKIVLDDLSCVFESGETIGLIGRNGAGKSTLLSILAGVANKTTGEVDIRGKVTAVMTLGIGLRDDLSGRDNIYLDGQLQGKTHDEIQACMDDIIEFAELNHFIDKPVKTYSTGMKSRLAFSMLVGIEPEILIIDEALSAGDVFFATKATKKIKEICAKGKIVIIVSHSMSSILSMCNRCLWLEAGQVVMDDEPSKVTAAYLQTVKKDDSQLAIHTQALHRSYTLDKACYKIQEISMRLMDRDTPQTVFYTHDSVVIAVHLNGVSYSAGLLCFTIERLDGLLVCHEQYDLQKLDLPDGRVDFIVELSLNLLVLNKGYYQIKLTLLENMLAFAGVTESQLSRNVTYGVTTLPNGRGSDFSTETMTVLTNEFIRCFEVKNPSISKGGHSLLHYPAEISLIEET